MRLWKLTSLCLSLAVLTACTQNHVVMLAPQTAGMREAASPESHLTEYQLLTAQPCLPSAEETAANMFATPRGIAPASAPISERAKTEKMSGCAAVRFHLAANGTPTDLQVMRENPMGYGYGQQAFQAVQASVYKDPDPAAWYYAVNVTTWRGNMITTFSGGPDHYAKAALYFENLHKGQ